MRIGIFGVGSQSGHAYLADLLRQGKEVSGFIPIPELDKQRIDKILEQDGLYLEESENREFYPISSAALKTDIRDFVENIDLIIITLPSIYHDKAIELLKMGGVNKKQIPIVFSPGRTLPVPYAQEHLGDGYPFLCLNSCPFSCKILEPGTAYIKMRKKTVICSVEGRVKPEYLEELHALIPGLHINRIPGTTSLGNVGAVLHPATYIINKVKIDKRRQMGQVFDFYIEGIVQNKQAANQMIKIDKIRIGIAKTLGLQTLDIEQLSQGLFIPEEKFDAVMDLQSWLVTTYDLEIVTDEDLTDTISRCPTYIKRSYPQLRYMDEDIPTGLVPMEALAQRLNIECGAISEIIDIYNNICECDIRAKGRNLQQFSLEYLRAFLTGELV